MSRTIRRALLSVSALALTAGAAHADFTLDILHINDLHSRIESIGGSDSTCQAEAEEAGECFGGVARLKTKVDERREALEAEGGNVLLLDAGDQFQGSLFYTTYKGEAEAEFMNVIGFDAMAIGNHEFDDGPEGLDAFIDLVEFPIISGNTIVAESSLLDGRFEPYLITEVGGERIGILSVVATDTDETSSPGNDITFQDEIEYLTGAVAELEAEGINKIILLSHVGYVRDQEIAAAVDGIDVIVGGHSHTLLANTHDGAAGPYPTLVANPSGAEVPIVQAYAYSKYLGELRVVFDDDGNVVSAEGEPHLLDASVEPDADVAARVAELREPIEELMTQRVSETTEAIDGSRETCRAQECQMGNLVADAMLDYTQDQGVQLVIQNGGGLRASIGEGEITMGDVISVLPFQNTLATFELTGDGIVEALENGLSQYEEQAGRFAQVAGLRYTFDVSQPVGERVVSVEVADGDGFAPIDPDETYAVATNNYMRGGGDGYSVFESEGRNAYDFGPGLEQVVADYLAANEPYTPYLDGRIVDASAADAAAPAEEAAETAPVEEAAPEAAEPEAAGTDATEEAEPDVAAPDTTEPEVTEPAEPAETPPAEAPAVDDAAREALEASPEAPDAAEDAAPAAPVESETAAPAEPVEEPAEGTAPGETMEPMEPTLPETDAAETAPEADTALPVEEDVTAEPVEPAPVEEDAATDPVEPAETAPAEAPAPAAPEQTHTIVAGDTFWDLAARYYGDPHQWQTIAGANPGVAERALEIGETLTIPPRP